MGRKLASRKSQIPFNLFLQIYPKETGAKCGKLLILKLLTVTSFIIAKDKKPKCPLTGNWLNKLWNTLQL